MSGLAVGAGAPSGSAGPGAIIEGLVGVLLAFVLTLPLLVLGVMGGGDAKLLMAHRGVHGARGTFSGRPPSSRSSVA